MLNYKFNHKLNVIKISKHETLKHKLAKIFTCIELMDNDIDFYTEAIFDSGHRADIFLPNLKRPVAYEIVVTESDKSIRIKEANYPCKVIKVKAEEVLKYWKKRIKVLR